MQAVLYKAGFDLQVGASVWVDYQCVPSNFARRLDVLGHVVEEEDFVAASPEAFLGFAIDRGVGLVEPQFVRGQAVLKAHDRGKFIHARPVIGVRVRERGGLDAALVDAINDCSDAFVFFNQERVVNGQDFFNRIQAIAGNADLAGPVSAIDGAAAELNAQCAPSIEGRIAVEPLAAKLEAGSAAGLGPGPADAHQHAAKIEADQADK